MRTILRAEFAARRKLNRRYSLRAFALNLNTNHSTLGRYLKGQTRMREVSLRTVGRRLGLSEIDVATAIRRDDEVAVLEAVGRGDFQPDLRWIASRTGLTIDRLQVALQSLLRRGYLQIPSPEQWTISEVKDA